MIIEKITKYRIGALEFDSVKAAEDYVEDMIDRKLRAALVDNGLGHTQMVRVTEAVLANRDFLVTMLSCKFEEDDEE